jgi:hypothetical protein
VLYFKDPWPWKKKNVYLLGITEHSDMVEEKDRDSATMNNSLYN